MEHSYFKSIAIGEDGVADLPDQTICGKTVACQLMQGTEGFTAADLDRFEDFCKAAEEHAEDAFDYIRDNHDEVVGGAYAEWFAGAPDLIKTLFPEAAQASDISGELTVARIAPVRIELASGDEAPVITIDFVFAGQDECGVLLAAEYDLDGQLEHVWLEE